MQIFYCCFNAIPFQNFHCCGNRKVSDPTAIESPASDFLYTLRQVYRFQCRAIIERTAANPCHTAGYGDLCQTGTVFKGTAINIGHALLNDHLLDNCPVVRDPGGAGHFAAAGNRQCTRAVQRPGNGIAGTAGVAGLCPGRQRQAQQKHRQHQSQERAPFCKFHVFLHPFRIFSSGSILPAFPTLCNSFPIEKNTAGPRPAGLLHYFRDISTSVPRPKISRTEASEISPVPPRIIPLVKPKLWTYSSA